MSSSVQNKVGLLSVSYLDLFKTDGDILNPRLDTNICHKDFHAGDSCGDKCDFDSIFTYYANLLNNSKLQSKLFRFFRMPSYGYSATYG